MKEQYDVVVVGGGAAGLSGALTLGRARRSVLVVDAGDPRNAPAGHVHNYLGREHTPPAELYAIGREEVARYGVEITDARVTATAGDVRRGFTVTLAGGTEVRARRLLIATGVVDELPAVPGLADRWGRDVLHCPYCHGWEVRDQAVGVLATGPMAVHGALLWRQWTPDVTLFLNGTSLADEQREELEARHVTLVEGAVTGLAVENDALTGVRLASGEIVPRDAVVVQTRLTPRVEVFAALGITTEEQVMNDVPVGSFVPVNPMGATSVPGVFAAGNVTNPFAQVIVSAGAGLMAASGLNMDLVTEETRRAVAARRLGLPGEDPAEMFTVGFWEQRYAGRNGHVWSGNPNPHLVTDAADLTPGRALDVGCGEGADAIWLARRGWQVTGTDLSPTALKRAAAHADEVGVSVTWEATDPDWTPPAGAYDLVTAHFVHPHTEARDGLFSRLAAAVAPGGTLLFVGHSYADVRAGFPRPDVPEMYFSAGDLVPLLAADEWEIEAAEERGRPATLPDGREAEATDVVLRARRRR